MKMKKWSSQWTQFMQLRKEAWKQFRTSIGFEPVTSRLPVQCSTNWTMKPLTLGAGQLWVRMFPWKKWVLMIYEINHIWAAEMNWKWRNDPNVSGFIAQLVEHRTGNREVTGSNPVEVLNFFQGSLRNCINCVHCDDHFFFIFKNSFIEASDTSAPNIMILSQHRKCHVWRKYQTKPRNFLRGCKWEIKSVDQENYHNLLKCSKFLVSAVNILGKIST